MSSQLDITEAASFPARKARPVYLDGITEEEVDALWDAIDNGSIDNSQARLLGRLGAPIRQAGLDCGELLFVEAYSDGRKHFIYQVPARRKVNANDDGWRVIHIDSRRVMFRALMVTNRHFSNRTPSKEGRAAA